MDPNIQQLIDARIRFILGNMQKITQVPDHVHSGIDSQKVSYKDIDKKILYASHVIYGATAATATNYGTFWIAPVACYVTNFWEIHQVVGSDGSAVTVTLEKLTGTTAPDSGVEMLSTALSLKATANTLQTGVLTETLTNRNLKAGDRLCLKDAGTLTAVSNVAVLAELLVI